MLKSVKTSRSTFFTIKILVLSPTGESKKLKNVFIDFKFCYLNLLFLRSGLLQWDFLAHVK
jgi:hypothetical protein